MLFNKLKLLASMVLVAGLLLHLGARHLTAQEGQADKETTPLDSKKLQQWIDDLDSDTFAVRERAYKELVRAGESIVPVLKEALGKATSAEVRRRLELIIDLHRLPTFDADFNGWHWVYGKIVHAQTFTTTGTKVKSLKLRVAQMTENRPTGALDVEIRDEKLETIYLKGTIDPAVLIRSFRWHAVSWKHVAPLEAKKTYVLVFHSRKSSNTGSWVINAIYNDVYPYGRHWYTAHEDFFFDMEYHDGKQVRVGPRGEQSAFPTPINSGAVGDARCNEGALELQTFGPIPAGKLHHVRADADKNR